MLLSVTNLGKSSGLISKLLFLEDPLKAIQDHRLPFNTLLTPWLICLFV